MTSNNDTNLMDNATLALDAMNLNCSPGFFIKLETGRCSPMCSVWEDLPHDVVVTFNVAYFFVHTFQFVGALVAFALSIYSYRIM